MPQTCALGGLSDGDPGFQDLTFITFLQKTSTKKELGVGFPSIQHVSWSMSTTLPGGNLVKAM